MISILEGNGQAMNIFDWCLPLRDSHIREYFAFTCIPYIRVVDMLTYIMIMHTGPGSIVLALGVSPITKYLGNSEAILTPYNQPLLILRPNLLLPERPIRPAENMSVSVIHNMRVSQLGSFQAANTKCSSTLCDKQRIFNGGRVSQTCGCYINSARVGKHALSFTLRLEKTGMEPLTVEFCSDFFLKTFLFHNQIAPGTGISVFNDFFVSSDIMDAYDAVLAGGNVAGGWTGVIWYKQGTVLDAAANPDGNNAPANVERVWVANGQVIPHLVSLYPSSPQRLNPAQMRAHRIDLSTLGQEAEA